MNTHAGHMVLSNHQHHLGSFRTNHPLANLGISPGWFCSHAQVEKRFVHMGECPCEAASWSESPNLGAQQAGKSIVSLLGQLGSLLAGGKLLLAKKLAHKQD